MKKACFALAVVLALLSVSAGAAVVTVTPVTDNPTGVGEVVENQLTDGWSIVTNRFGIGELTGSGPSAAEREYPWNTAEDGTGIDMGSGAFYAACQYNGQGTGTPEAKTPSTVWLGVDTFNGQPLAGIKLKQIKTLNYWAFVSKNPSRMQAGTDPNNWDSWGMGWLYPSHPIMLQFTLLAPPETGLITPPYNRIQLLYKPWGGSNLKGDVKYEDGLGIWKQYNPFNGGQWMVSPQINTAPVVSIAGDFQTLCNTPCGVAPNLSTYGEATLMVTTTDFTGRYDPGYKSPGWNGTTLPEGWYNTTGTGKPLNFQVGARMSTIIWPDNLPDPDDPLGDATNWAHQESIGFRGQMDWFTLGIDLNGDGDDGDAGEKSTYNFEPAATDQRPTHAYLSLKDLARGGVNSIFENRQQAHRYDVLYKVSGRVTATGNVVENPWFELNDGSGINPTVRVYCSRISRVPDGWWPPDEGDYYEAEGFLEIPRWPATLGTPTITLPYVLWSDIGRFHKISN